MKHVMEKGHLVGVSTEQEWTSRQVEAVVPQLVV